MNGIREAEREKGRRKGRVEMKLAAWERPLVKSGFEAPRDSAPKGVVLGVRGPVEAEELLLRTEPKYCFTTPHVDGHPAILIQLQKAPVGDLKRLLESACEQR